MNVTYGYIAAYKRIRVSNIRCVTKRNVVSV